MTELEQLQKAWRNRNLIPFVGSGVSQGAAGLPSWPALLQKGVEYLRRRKKELKIREVDIKAIAAAAKADKLIDGFGILQRLLGAPASDRYQAFFLEQFDKPVVARPKILNAIRGLAPRVVVTTNYDLLLEKYNVVDRGDTATWLEPRDIFSLLRGGQGVIHLHGRYDYPQSVILSSDDYTRIVHVNEESTKVAQALFHSGILLFIGCSVAGVDDPHLSTLLGEFAKLQGPLLERAEPHFILFKDDAPAEELAVARRLGLKPVSYGKDYDNLPDFLSQIRGNVPSRVPTDSMRTLLQTLEGAQSKDEIFGYVRDFIENVIYPGRKIRIGFAQKMEEAGKIFLRNQYLIPAGATHNDFSYPQTLAAWALIEGRILAIPDDWDRACDFGLLRKVKKLKRVQDALLKTNAAEDPVLGNFLKPEVIREKAQEGTLTIREIYQNWVGRQPQPHYNQFASIPVPIIERVNNILEPPEYGVLNIDTAELEPLVSEDTAPLLKLLSDAVALAFAIDGNRPAGART